MRFTIRSLLLLTAVCSVLAAVVGAWIRPDASRGAIVVFGYGIGLTVFTLAWAVHQRNTGTLFYSRIVAALFACTLFFWGGLLLALYGDNYQLQWIGIETFLVMMPLGGAVMSMAASQAIASGGGKPIDSGPTPDDPLV